LTAVCEKFKATGREVKEAVSNYKNRISTYHCQRWLGSQWLQRSVFEQGALLFANRWP